MYHLLEKDGLVLPYAVSMVGFFALMVVPSFKMPASTDVRAPGYNAAGQPSTLIKGYVVVRVSCGLSEGK